MFKSVTVTNYLGDSLELPLKWPNDAGLLLYKIDGITPSDVTVHSQDFAVLDGGVYNSSRIGTRNISLYFYYGFDPHIETSRHRAYRYFPVKEQVRLDFLTDERNLSIWGYVEGNDTQIFSEQEEGKVDIVCPDPYFYEHDNVSYILGEAVGEFEFPFSNESLTEPLICFGEWANRYTYDVDYHGDIEVGAVIRIFFNIRPTNIDEIVVHDVTHYKLLTLNIQDIKNKTGIDIQQYSRLVFSSVRGAKDIYYEYFGTRKSIIGMFNVMNFPWMYLTPGENLFALEVDELYRDDITVTVEHRGAYGGV